MPPPRLSRQLRSCHPAASVQWAAYVSNAGYTTRAPHSGDAEQSPGHITASKPSWWTTAFTHFASSGTGTDPVEPRSATSLGTRVISKSGSESDIETETAAAAPPPPPRGSQTSHDHEFQALGATCKDEMGKEDKLVTSGAHGRSLQDQQCKLPRPATEPSDAMTIQTLLEQIRTMQATLNRMLEQQSQHPLPAPTASLATHTVVPTPSPGPQSNTQNPRPKYGRAIRLAHDRLRGSTHCLIRAANILNTMSPGVRNSLHPIVAQQIRMIEATIPSNDDRMKRILRAYKQPLSVASGTSTAKTVLCATAASLSPSSTSCTDERDAKGRVRYVQSRLGFKDCQKNLHLALVHADKGYRHSVDNLVAIANQLHALKSNGVHPLAYRTHAMLRIVAEDAKRARDQRVLNILQSYKRRADLPFERVVSTAPKSDQHFLPGTVALKNKKRASENGRIATLSEHIISPLESLQSASLILECGSPKKVGPSTYSNHAQVSQYEAPIASSGHEGVRPATTTLMDYSDTVHGKMERKNNDVQRLTRQIHTHSRTLAPSKGVDAGSESTSSKFDTCHSRESSKSHVSSDLKADTIPNASAKSRGSTVSQSLLEELFPEANRAPEPTTPEKREQYPKLDLPDSTPIIRREFVDRPKSLKEQVKLSFQERGEQITVLQLTNCSTNLTEVDFLRLIPKGRHIEGWRRDGEFVKVIPGRDPLSLSRMPFYYILFKSPESALAYQKNVSRIHKLSALHQPSSIFSAIPPPSGYLEDGEDINNVTSSYNLFPTRHKLSLVTLVQPYNPALRALIERGGYRPIAPGVDEHGHRVYKVLMHIEGYEPMPSDLFKILKHDAFKQGMTLTLRNESSKSIHRLRDVINLRTSAKSISTASPRAYGSFEHRHPDATEQIEYEDPAIQAMMSGADEDVSVKEINQYMMNRLYNRWILDFEDEDVAQRFAINWHRRLLPEVPGSSGWKDTEEARVCNTEVLW